MKTANNTSIQEAAVDIPSCIVNKKETVRDNWTSVRQK
jgi:hypothetical protein